MSRWLAEGRTLGQSLRRYHALVVAGSDADAAAEVALGIAEAQSAERKVILGDLSANTGPLAALIGDDDPHGLVDAFDYGISLGRVARQVKDNANLQFAPTGSTPPDYAELLAHPRWSRLFTAFTDADHLLVLLVPNGAQGLDDLVNQLEGLVLVDAIAPARVEASRIIANVTLAPLPLPRMSQVTSAPTPTVRKPATGSGERKRAVAGAAAQGAGAGPPPPAARSPQPARRQTTVLQAFAKPAGYGAGLSILGAFIIFWLLGQPFGDNEPRSAIPGPLQTALRTPVPAAPPPPDPNQLNPADSGAAVYAVRMSSANTEAGAILSLQRFGASLPAATYAPVDKSGQTWYEVLTGAFTTRGGADSLLTSLRSAGRLDSIRPGVVVRVPYAVMIDSVRPAGTVFDLLTSLRIGRKLPVYALVQGNGWLWIVAGAFETRAQADAYAEKIRASGQQADVVFRQGRVF